MRVQKQRVRFVVVHENQDSWTWPKVVWSKNAIFNASCRWIKKFTCLGIQFIIHSYENASSKKKKKHRIVRNFVLGSAHSRSLTIKSLAGMAHPELRVVISTSFGSVTLEYMPHVSYEPRYLATESLVCTRNDRLSMCGIPSTVIQLVLCFRTNEETAITPTWSSTSSSRLLGSQSSGDWDRWMSWEFTWCFSVRVSVSRTHHSFSTTQRARVRFLG